MTNTHAKGMAVAVIDHGKVGYIHAYGIRDAKGDPLTSNTAALCHSSVLTPKASRRGEG
jgi:CubicO group peptidase (beta-lactamase class C family)